MTNLDKLVQDLFLFNIFFLEVRSRDKIIETFNFTRNFDES